MNFKAVENHLGLMLDFECEVTTNQITTITTNAYAAAWQMAQQKSYGEFLRVWNYIPQINYFEDGIENYQRFCLGRKNSFEHMGLDSSRFPAASAVGNKDDRIAFKFLFCKTAPLKISNPMQIEAYAYPSQYGPVPPSFARAAVIDDTVFLSGTASIRGHVTLHPEDVLPQTLCTIENIDLLLDQCHKKAGLSVEKNQMQWRVYLKNPDDLTKVSRLLSEKLGLNIEYVDADICRSQLVIEIEGALNGI